MVQAVSAALKQAPAPVAVVVQASIPPAARFVDLKGGCSLQPSCNSVDQLEVTAAGHERLTNGNTALAHWIREIETSIG